MFKLVYKKVTHNVTEVKSRMNIIEVHRKQKGHLEERDGDFFSYFNTS